MEDPSRQGRHRALLSPFAAASLVWLYQPRLNFLLEAVASRDAGFDDRGQVERSTTTILSPGLCWAINRGGLQIVPGLALPVTLSGGDSSLGVFLYFSLEHPF